MMIRKMIATAAAALACSGAMAGSQTFTFNSPGNDPVNFSGSLLGGITNTFGATLLTNVLLDGGTDGLTAGVALGGGYLNYSFSLASTLTQHTVSYDVLTFGAGAGAATFKDVVFTSIPHQASQISGTNQAAVVPEPESYAMLLAGLGALGFMGRRRNKAGKA